MASAESLIRSVSDTALWTAAYRAEESERPDALFIDPFAERLAGTRGAEIARTIRHPLIRSGVVTRTVAIDRIITNALNGSTYDTIVSLGAGLDARPYRMSLPGSVRWVELDLPPILEYKASVLADETPRCALEAIGVDLADVGARRNALQSAMSRTGRTMVLTEGLLQYLSEEMVAALARDLASYPSVLEWVTDLLGPRIGPAITRAGADMGSEDALMGFAPPDSAGFFGSLGWREVEFVDFFMDAGTLGRESLPGKVLRGIASILPAGPRSRFERGLGVARMERQGIARVA